MALHAVRALRDLLVRPRRVLETRRLDALQPSAGVAAVVTVATVAVRPIGVVTG